MIIVFVLFAINIQFQHIHLRFIKKATPVAFTRHSLTHSLGGCVPRPPSPELSKTERKQLREKSVRCAHYSH